MPGLVGHDSVVEYRHMNQEVMGRISVRARAGLLAQSPVQTMQETVD